MATAVLRSQEKRCVIRVVTRYELLIDDIRAAILRPRGFVVTRRHRLFLAEAHGFDLRVRARPAFPGLLTASARF